MSTTTKSLNRLITLLDEQLDAAVMRAVEAERDLSMLKEQRDQWDEATRRSVDYAVERVRREADRAREDLERSTQRYIELERDNRNLRARLQKFEGAKIKEAAAWLRTASIEYITVSVNESNREQYGEDSRPVNPLVDKIPMIKYVRNTWDLGLKEAKDVVDAWYAERLAADEPITESEQRLLDGNR